MFLFAAESRVFRAPSTMARPRNHLLLFSPFTTLGWRVTRRISQGDGEAGVTNGKMRRILDETGRHIGYQPVKADPRPSLPSDPSRTALAVPETKANAGLLGQSRTASLTEEQRRTRVHPKSGRLLPEEDFIERTQKLMQVYTQSANFAKVHGRTGDRAVRVYPRAPQRAV